MMSTEISAPTSMGIAIAAHISPPEGRNQQYGWPVDDSIQKAQRKPWHDRERCNSTGSQITTRATPSIVARDVMNHRRAVEVLERIGMQQLGTSTLFDVPGAMTDRGGKCEYLASAH